MEFREVENLLYEYGEIASKIKQLRDELQNELESRKDILNLLRAGTITDMPRGTGESDPVFQAVAKAVDIFLDHIERLRVEIECLNKKRDFVDELLRGLSSAEIEVIGLRYFKKYGWEMVALKSRYSRNQCLNIRNSAVKKIAG